jgi:eukaryotic-like serine/threonine-protein kinase
VPEFLTLQAALSDRYRLERELGRGGMATVYLARDLRHDRLVAVKVLRPELAQSLGPERFLREIKLAAQLQHPHILPVHDSGEMSGLLYYVMPYVDGESLRDRLNREKQLPVSTAVRIATEVASALDYAHRHQVIHRDIKPENILLHEGRALVADFGVALPVSPPNETRITETGLSLGTPQYMSPEQAMGERTLDARTDIYAIGCVLYESLTGEPPFTGLTAQAVVAKVITDAVRPPTQLRKMIPPHVEAAVLTALQKLPADRFETASEFAEALAWPRALTLPELGGAGGRSWLRDQRSWAALALAAAALVSSAVLLMHSRDSRDGWSNVSFIQKSFRREGILVARFAPDEQTLVYSATTQGTIPRLYIVRPDYAEPQALGPDSTHLLAISSKGEMAVLTGAVYIGHRLCVGTLARLAVDGGAPREIMADVREADWSPDGSQLAIVHSVSGKDRLEYPVGKVLYEYSGYLSDLRISPQGDRIAFFEHPVPEDDRGLVAMVDLAGRRTPLSGTYQALEGLGWAPNGQSLFYSGQERGGFLQVHGLRVHGKPRLVLPSAGTLTLQDVANDGRWLVTRGDEMLRTLVQAPGQGEELDVSWLENSIGPVLSSDGQLMVLADESAGAGPNYAIIMRRTNGSPVARLGEGTPFALSPDKHWVLAGIPTTPHSVVLYPTGAGETWHLAVGAFASITQGEFFPDGRAFLICGNQVGQAKRCYMGSLDRAGVRPVTPEGSSGAVVSPDGRQVLAQVTSGEYRLFPLAGGESRPVSGLSAVDKVARWSPDGRAAFVWRPRELPVHVERYDLVTGRRTPLITIAPNDQSVLAILTLSLADDPHVYAYTRVEHSAQLFIVTGVR